MTYHDLALSTYGTCCEWVGCGWAQGDLDAHHINYQHQQELESELRTLSILTDMNSVLKFKELQAQAIAEGFGNGYSLKTGQLPKKDTSDNLMVLCPNHHRFLHSKDLGMAALAYVPPRK